jgi:hypothetical protein
MLPPELIDKIFKEGESNPRNVRLFGKFMSTKTKQKNINCKKVIDTGDVKKVRLLKFHNSKCTHSDLIYSLEKGHIGIAKYINSAYPEATIKYGDIVSNIADNNNDMVNKLLDLYKFNNIQEYYHMFSLLMPHQKQTMKIILDNRPNKNALIVLSELFDDDMTFFILNLDDYFKNFRSVAKNIVIDDTFVSKLLISHEFRNLEILFKYQRKKIKRDIKTEILRFVEQTMDTQILDFMDKNKDIF